MYSSKPTVNALASLMLLHGIKHVVVCPGSRNAPLVHNFHQLSCTGRMSVYPVTDERSAAFVAIGLYLALRQPVGVCVTSGSALLNTLPAVAEAYYRHAPLLVVSADRPAEQIGNLRGQTLPQDGALQPYTPTWQLHEALSEDDVQTLISQALRALSHAGGHPVHINVPLSEPLHNYDAPSLPVYAHEEAGDSVGNPCPFPESVMKLLREAELPAVYVGHMDFPPTAQLRQLEQQGSALVLSEAIGSSVTDTMFRYHRQLRCLADYAPDVIVHIGGTGIERDYGWLLRNPKSVVIRIEPDPAWNPRPFDRPTHQVHTGVEEALRNLLELPPNPHVKRFYQEQAIPPLSPSGSMAGKGEILPWLNHVEAFLKLADAHPHSLHVGNSTILRHFSRGRFPGRHILCNRGVNGIEGTLSVAAGHSLGTDELVYCMLGDLSFFYDSNALWNSRLRGNLRILLFNDGGGSIFQRLSGLSRSEALPVISARHRATAEGICRSYGADHIAVTCPDALSEALRELTLPATARPRPLVVECFA